MSCAGLSCSRFDALPDTTIFPPPRRPWLAAFVATGLAAIALAVGPGCGSESPGAGDDDAALPPLEPYTCQTALASAGDMCPLTWTGKVEACSVDGDGKPSKNGWLEVSGPAGEHGFVCASNWTEDGGYFFSNDREHLTANAADCCAATAAVQSDDLAFDRSFGLLHAPTHVKPQEMIDPPGGELRQNPFAVVVGSAEDGAKYQQALQEWLRFAGDGQAHPGPDGQGAYYFPAELSVGYVVVPTSAGAPLIVIAPEISMDPDFDTPLGHPTLGACDGQGGAPLAYIAGAIYGDTISNGSGRFGYELTITKEALDNTQALFNCYGIPVSKVEWFDPALH
jgi:hypothetical protein